MKQKGLLLAIAILTVGLFFLQANSVHATPYAFMMDRFEIVGNSPGNFVDEFDDGSLGVEWFDFRPTVTESNGVLTLSSPGQSSLSHFGNLLVREETTAINSRHPGPLSVLDGAGDFTGTSTWLPVLPGVNQMFFMEIFHHLDPHLTGNISIGVSNFESTIADALGFPTTGLGLFFGQESPNGDLLFQSITINSTDVTNNILLQLAFSDSSDEFTGSYSLNGGGTFQSPFTVFSPYSLANEFKWGMHALSFEPISEPVPEPTTVLLLGTGLLGLAGASRKKF